MNQLSNRKLLSRHELGRGSSSFYSGMLPPDIRLHPNDFFEIFLLSVQPYTHDHRYDFHAGEKASEFGAVSPTGQQISPLLLALFMLLANVLLLNLLIAIFR